MSASVLWTLEEAISVARGMEKICAPQGFHVALGGGTLMNGNSRKDLDLFFYPHRRDAETPTNFKRLRGILTTLGGITNLGPVDFGEYDHKEVFQGKLQGRRVDLFFLS